MTKKILLCDDDENIVEVMQLMLEEAGYTVRALTTSNGIIEEIEHYQPALVILDIWLKDGDGREHAKAIKARFGESALAIMFVSALGDIETIFSESGVDDYIMKPFDMEDFLAKVKRLTE